MLLMPQPPTSMRPVDVSGGGRVWGELDVLTRARTGSPSAVQRSLQMLHSASRLLDSASCLRILRWACARASFALLAMLFVSCGLFAQNYSWDARNVGMGGVTSIGEGNLAAELVPPERSYTSIVVPLGLFQVLSNLEVFDPDDPDFDVLRAIDYVG